MGRAGILIILMLAILSPGKAQQDYSFRRIDSSMYANTLKKDWQEVIRVGKIALDKNFEYYYLRLRMGIAYFNKKNYRIAVQQFEEAKKLNPDDDLLREYLYYAYLFAGEKRQAELCAANWSMEFRERTSISKRSVISNIYLETGPEFNNNIDKNAVSPLKNGISYRMQDLYGNSYYTHFGLSLNLHPRVSIYAGYSNLMINKQSSLQYAWNIPDSVVENTNGFGKYFPENPHQEKSYYEYTLKQNSFYLNANILAGNGWSVTPAMQYIHVNTQSMMVADLSQTIIDTSVYIADIDTTELFEYTLLDFEFRPETIILNNFVFSLAVNKQLSIFDLGLFGSWSNLNDQSQLQFGFSATYYPFGNLNFYGNSSIKYLIEEDDSRPVFHQMLGVKATNFLWLEGFGTFGNLKNTNESNTFVVYNLTDNINFKTGLNLIFVVTPALSLSLRYQYMQKEAFRMQYDPARMNPYRIIEMPYSTNSILGGLKWIF